MTSSTPIADRGLRALSCTLGTLNAILWFAVVPIADGWDRLLGRIDVPGRPQHMFGAQELLVFFDPWLAVVVLPIVYTFGFATIGIIFRAPRGTDEKAFASREAIGLSAALVGCEAIWIGLIVIAVACRGPDWNFYGPFEPWAPGRIVPLNPTFLSALFWKSSFPENELAREAPGMFLIAAYLMVGVLLALALWRGRGYFAVYLGSIAIAGLVASLTIPIESSAVFAMMFVVFGYLIRRWMPRIAQRMARIPFWRCLLIALLMTLAVAVPIKIVLFETLNVRNAIRLWDSIRV
jgi:hypothetical protein